MKIIENYLNMMKKNKLKSKTEMAAGEYVETTSRWNWSVSTILWQDTNAIENPLPSLTT